MKTILTILFLLVLLNCDATNHYVNATGSDAAAGTIGAPWQTISKVNSSYSSFAAGDSVLFNRGDIFTGGIITNKNGVPGAPIVIGAYGTGPMPIITGFVTVSAWTNLGSNIWESTSAISTLSTCNLVLINGSVAQLGREPNSGYLTFQSHSGSTSITSSSLTGTPNWTGAEAVIRSRRSSLDRCLISAQTGGTLTIAATSVTPTDSYGFFIQNDVRTLDVQNEWYYNPSTKKLRIFSVGSPTGVQATTVDTLVTMHHNYTTITGLRFTGANSYVMSGNFAGSHRMAVINDSINYTGIDAIKMAGMDSITCTGTAFTCSNNNAVNLFFACPYATFDSDYFDSTGVFPGMGQSGTEAYTALDVQNHNTTATNCQIIKTGYSAVKYFGDSCNTQHNLTDTFCFVLDDGGAYYSQSQVGTFIHRKVLNNIALNGIGAPAGTNNTAYIPAEGVYLDDNSQNVEVAFNSCAHIADHGIFFHNAANINVHDNVNFDDSIAIGTQHDATGISITGCNFQNNISVARSATQYAAFYLSSQPNDLINIGTFDNNYYARPIDDNLTITTQTFSGAVGTTTNRTLGNWQAYIGSDAHSNKSPKTITDVNDFRFEYNWSSSPKIVSLGFNYIGIDGTTYNGSVTVPAYGSVVMIKNGAIIIPGNSILKFHGNVKFKNL